ncbi:MAG TPA: hypothetical protein P5163_14035 [Rubrivivax sp.]|jgi:hypothetical protein|nr:hypothetical protein [Rubrivivax sp.]HRY88257.1 hypothetical protein [Rubrivivax sp.]HRZ61706.1 hypothetical protein [Rubrivivax sp.]
MKVIASGPPGTDGMTLLVAANNVATINPFVFSKLKYSFADDQITVRHFSGGYVQVANRPATTARHGSASSRRAGRRARRSTGLTARSRATPAPMRPTRATPRR